MLNVHPSLLPRWRGAAPIERAIMAGDAEHRASAIMRLTAGLDSGPVALREETPIGAEEDFGALSRAARGARRRAAGRARSTCWPPATLEFAEQDEDGGHLRREDRRRRAPARSRPRPADELARGGPRADPAHRRLPGARGRRAARRAPRPSRSTAGPSAGRARVRTATPCCSAAAEGALRIERGAAAGQAADGRPTPTCAATRPPHALARERRRSRRAPSVAFEVVRATFEDGALHRPRVPRRAPSARELDGRERAQAQRLAYGAVQRRGTTDAAIDRLAGRSPRLLDPPVARRAAARPLRAALRRRRPPTTPPSTRRSSSSRAPAPPTPPASSTRSCAAPARERDELRRRCSATTRTPEAAAVAHSVPLWLARDVVGRARAPTDARSLLRGLQRAGRARRCGSTRCATARRAPCWRGCAARASRRAPAPGAVRR